MNAADAYRDVRLTFRIHGSRCADRANHMTSFAAAQAGMTPGMELLGWEINDPEHPFDPDRMMECSTCHGGGFAIDGDPCSTCGGLGWEPMPEEPVEPALGMDPDAAREALLGLDVIIVDRETSNGYSFGYHRVVNAIIGNDSLSDNGYDALCLALKVMTTQDLRVLRDHLFRHAQ